MPKKLQKSLQAYLLKIKNSTNHLHDLPSKTLSSKTSWIIRGCKHPKTPSFAAANVKQNEEHETNDDAATLSDIDRFLFENFSSLFQEKNHDDDDDNDDKGKKGDVKEKNNGEKPDSGVLLDSPRFFDLPENFRGSHRFFVQSSTSGSLIEEARTSMNTSEDMASSSTTTTSANDSKGTDDDSDDDDDAKEAMAPDGFITLLAYSPDPYNDFRQSMHEMIEARLHFHGKVDWAFMEELLFCYLNLNDKKSYKFILSAFVDLVVALRENSGRVLAKSQKVRSVGERRMKREI